MISWMDERLGTRGVCKIGRYVGAVGRQDGAGGHPAPPPHGWCLTTGEQAGAEGGYGSMQAFVFAVHFLRNQPMTST